MDDAIKALIRLATKPVDQEQKQFNKRVVWSVYTFRLVLFFAVSVLLLLILLPVVALLLQSTPFEVFKSLQQPEILSALRVTLITSSVSTGLIFLLGLPSAYAFSRFANGWRPLLDSLLELPMVMPPVVAGLALLLSFGRQGLVGQFLLPFGISIPFTLMAVILAQMFVIIPYFVKRSMVLFDGVDSRLEEASALLGAGPFYTLLHVTLPLCLRGLLAEVVMAFAQGVGIFGVILLFAGNLQGRTQTLSLAIYTAFERDPQQAFVLASLLLMISCLLLTLFRFLSKGSVQSRSF